jgi:hypothetical protein
LAGAFFAVAITFLLDQVERALPCAGAMPMRGSYSLSEVAQEGRPGTVNGVANRWPPLA